MLILGGARSGKSRHAEQVATEWGGPVLYVAVAEAFDAEMAERIRLHQAQRPTGWRTLEAPLETSSRVSAALGDARTVLMEDLTLLLSNLMRASNDVAEASALAEVDRLVALPANVILVSNEVGMGVVPPYPLGREFRDSLGRVNQHAATACDDVLLIVAGLPLRLK